MVPQARECLKRHVLHAVCSLQGSQTATRQVGSDVGLRFFHCFQPSSPVRFGRCRVKVFSRSFQVCDLDTKLFCDAGQVYHLCARLFHSDDPFRVLVLPSGVPSNVSALAVVARQHHPPREKKEKEKKEEKNEKWSICVILSPRTVQKKSLQ